MSAQTLTWTRPDFLALRYELRCPEGLVAKVSVTGMGSDRHALGETSEGAWRFEVFPFASQNVLITRAEDQAEMGSYSRQAPFEICTEAGKVYRLNGASILEDENAHPVFSYEQVESFPRWTAEIKLSAGAMEIAELPLLLVSDCCSRVFR